MLPTLQTYFGFDSFRPGQSEAITSLLAGNHTLTVMPTGAGKSLIYQLAGLQLPGLTLVISPLIALMKDQVDSLARRKIPVTYINSTLPAGEQSRRLQSLAQGKYRIVYVAPERLRSASFLNALRTQTIGLLAVDEAHCISEWGHDFRPDYLHIAQARAEMGNPLTVALTATATPQVQSDIIHLLHLGNTAQRIVTGFNRVNLSLNVQYTHDTPVKLRVLTELLKAHQSGAVIVYTGTRRDAEEVAEFVQQTCQLHAAYYHAGLPAEERTRVQEAFITGQLNFVSATNAFGMGIDRADVRQVIHYSLPGSLEAYYQEAGRAGRDGRPAWATLLYDPKDRALQEWFIDNSQVSLADLQVIYNAIKNGSQTWVTLDELSRLSGLQLVQLRVGLAGLERAGAIEHLGDEGLRMLLRKGSWDAGPIEKATRNSLDHIQHRKAQLEKIVAYAETNSCRRKMILVHFGDMNAVSLLSPAVSSEKAKGDSAETDALDIMECCDNCQALLKPIQPAGGVDQMALEERAALVLLDCVQRLNPKVGKGKLTQILQGSHSQDILKFHYDRNKQYAKLAALQKKEIEAMIDQMVSQGYFKIIGGKYPVISLTSQGESALQRKERIALRLPELLTAADISQAKAKRQAGGTVEYTSSLFAQGLTPEQIAQQRNCSRTTIYNHLATLIEKGVVPIEQVVPADIRARVETAIQQVGATDYLAPIKSLLPEEIDYAVIRCVMASHVKALKASGQKQSIDKDDCQRIVEQEKPIPDAVDIFLNESHPRPLKGPWQVGWSLGFHSRFSGADWSRSGVGSLAYRLKYQNDTSVIPSLVEQVLELIQKHPELSQVDLILPVPPSQNRDVDPVLAFSKACANALKIPVQAIIMKTRQTQPQKELKNLAQKHANVAGAFVLRGNIEGKRLLLVDDLFDTGATLEEITHLLLKQGASQVNVLTITRTIHSDT